MASEQESQQFGAGDGLSDGLLGPREWLVLGAVLIAFYLYRKFSHLIPMADGNVLGGSSSASDAESRRRHVQEARARLIEESERKAAAKRERLKELEEQRRLERVARKERLLDISKALPSDANPAAGSSSATRRTDYNPLMGSGGSCGWRPSKKGPAKGG